ncbi:unnamed protein product [Rotaria sp. Silwood1]|nr:unnamed protein product [Rotaria sp. Silwood1]CAF3369008.1 unnamed protein product [Rotaria sp. Silwood1]CAF3399957.1 unnamed protein product [Rotaria sp. Silwood1]CAF3403305.1 unnamed protein product [Rotaria sp. Silwood1]CAF4828204.1 unnamed protein product [Rotaria sp. Silwood1]
MNEDMYIQLSFYSQPIIILVGTVGSLLNQIIFHRRKSLRTASCSLYFRSLSINDLLVLYIIVLTQWLNDQFHFDLTIKYLWYCKIQTYIMHCLYAVSPYFLVLGCFDRLCRTSRNIQLRQMATLNMARQISHIIIILICIAHCHILFQYNIIHSMCIPINIFYFQFFAYFHLVFHCLLPPILMSIFCGCTAFLLYRRRCQQQLQYKLNIYISHKRIHYRDYQLIKILFLYVTTNVLCTLPFALVFLQYVYKYNSDPQLSIIVKFTVLLANLNYCSSFYIYTLGTPLYRRELLHLIKTFR